MEKKLDRIYFLVVVLVVLFALTCLIFILACVSTPADISTNENKLIICTDSQVEALLKEAGIDGIDK